MTRAAITYAGSTGPNRERWSCATCGWACSVSGRTPEQMDRKAGQRITAHEAAHRAGAA